EPPIAQIEDDLAHGDLRRRERLEHDLGERADIARIVGLGQLAGPDRIERDGDLVAVGGAELGAAAAAAPADADVNEIERLHIVAHTAGTAHPSTTRMRFDRPAARWYLQRRIM